NVTTMIGLGVGIDYSLLLLRRFREELERDAAVEDAVVRTVATAGATVGTSGLCVAVGFAALLFTPLVETRSIGIGGLVVVAVAVALALTLVPALLAVLGRRVARRSASELAARRLPVNGRGIAASAVGPSRGLSRDRAAVLWEHWARALTRRPGLALLAGGLTLACLTAPVAWLRVGLPARHWWPSQTEAGKGLDLLTRIGGAGAVQPVRRARRLAAAPPPALARARIFVGGYVAQHVDFQDDLLGRVPLLVGVVFGATALMLGVVFRSVLIPLKAILLNALSVGSTLGLIVLVFQRGGNGTEAIFVAVPVLVFAVVFGLSMDYEVFLLSRIKEAFDSDRDNERATIMGLSATAGVITAAALL